ncbi:MAG: GIY-YIG nuclease family protein [Cytophagales bacterium]
MFSAYVLRSESTKTHYYGSTEDLSKRLKEHNSGKVRYTIGRRPCVLNYFEDYKTRSEATKREFFF